MALNWKHLVIVLVTIVTPALMLATALASHR